MFQNFPYTDMHQLNLDWIIKTIKDFEDHKEEIINGLAEKVNKPTTDPDGKLNDVLISLGNGQTFWGNPMDVLDIQEAVDNWLADHPEATTTVEDHSIAKIKLTEELQKEVINHYVTPQMFGAVGDGVTDDTDAFQAALNFAHDNNYLPVCLISDYRITNTLMVPERVSIFALTIAEARYRIFVDENVDILFDCAERTTFKNIAVSSYNNVYRDNTIAFYFRGINGNSDSQMKDCQIAKIGIGAYCPSRNVDFLNCLFSHCRYGISIELPENNTGMRGMNIIGCRFHGIGEEYEIYEGVQQEMLVTGRCSSILLKADTYQNVTQLADIIIEDCISDQSGTFITGYAQFCLVSNCYIKSFANPAFIIDGGVDGTLHPSYGGTWLITGCTIDGIRGTDFQGVFHSDPDHLITIARYGRVTVDGCVLGRCNANPIHVEKNCSDLVFSNNALIYTRTGTALIEIYDSSNAVCKGNTNLTGTNLFIATGNSNDTTSHVTDQNNTGFKYNMAADAFKGIYPYAQMVTIGSFTSGSVVAGITNLPEFYARLTDGHSYFKCTKFIESYYDSTVSVNNATGEIYSIQVDHRTDKVYLVKTLGETVTKDETATLYLYYYC